MRQKIIVSVYHSKRNWSTLSNEWNAQHALFEFFNPDQFVHVANVLVNDTYDDVMLQEAFDSTVSKVIEGISINWHWHSNITPVNRLVQGEPNRDSRSGDVFVIYQNVWMAQHVGWQNIGRLTLLPK